MGCSAFVSQKKKLLCYSFFSDLAAVISARVAAAVVSARLTARVTAAAIVIAAEQVTVTAQKYKNNYYDNPNPAVASTAIVTISEKSHRKNLLSAYIMLEGD